MNLPQQRSNTKVVFWLFALVVIMFGFGYAMVPLYNVFCQVLGINGKTGGKAEIAQRVDESRWVTVEFLTTKNAGLPWKFYPLVKKVKVHPGQSKQIQFFAQNDSGKTMTVQAIPSLSPGIAAKYMKKTECFCFNQQTLKAGESIDMPMIFHIDTSLPKNIRTVTLSYTMFNTAGIRVKQSKQKGKIN